MPPNDNAHTLEHKKSAPEDASSEIPGESVFLAADAATETLLEFVDTAARIHNLLLASVERVALGTDIQLQIMPDGGAGLDDVTAGTRCGNIAVLGVNTFFHGEPL